MKRIRVSADLEREIRAYQSKYIDDARLSNLFDSLVGLLNEDEPKKAPGIGYSKIVECLREGLGARLAVPEKPHVSWIIKQVNRVKELGLDEQQLRALGRSAAQAYNNSRPIELEFILRAAVRIAAVDSGGSGSTPREGRVYTGRDDE